jgi:hypothetical protein
MLILAAALLLDVQDNDVTFSALRIRIESAPQGVATFIERRTGCQHFWGEVSGNPERDAQVHEALEELRCDDIEADERTLRKAHQGKPEVLKLLDDTTDLMPW